ncbi:MAG: ABC transporter substrate-binding protein [Candidatus Liptonbacteria bacterium]|nr:ABC transporter substrate-binding protein [Candidatus Liptonbacteria bacterium]
MTKIIVGIVIVLALVGVVFWVSGKPAVAPAPGGPAGSQSVATGPIKIGVIQPLSGDIAAIGEAVRYAIEIARDEVNATGGINGHPIELVEEDSKCDPKTAASAASKLVNINKVIAIVGAGCSSETLAAAPIVEAARIPMISPVSTNPKVTQAGDYVFRFAPSDAFQGKFAAEYAVQKMGKKNIAILSCLSDWCVGIKDVFRARATELGATIVADEQNKQDDRDLRTQITKIKVSKPDLVYVPQYTEALIVFLKQAKELGLNVTFLTGDVGTDPKIPAEAGTTAEGTYYTEPKTFDMPASFVAEMKKRMGGQDISTYAPRGYDALKALAGIMQKVGADPTAIKDALYQIKDYHGIADNYTIDQNGDMATALYTVRKYQGGKGVVVE